MTKNKIVKCVCPKCKGYNITMINGLKEQHYGGDKWCLDCGRIFDAEDISEMIADALEKGNRK
jgi:transposase-like protein